ncbi:pyridoxamine 5'-phosphate oxidase family protein [Pseudomonas sp. CCC3.2]|uniref:pyridoxamine 5'-phosphate oxidase family protein n=1 Tax=unclassified Pseudomonas TaxID=196821 RepID=UPI002AB4645C|nr:MULTISPECIES: pyridoxamine 5'-phosphate oxidase family protein [unclassified Pseudomonas]MDY7560967.1 pyridoxamine 5'-phosphate oxidase family protein [Pseudomonas sp. AB6]MEB0180416.1 pyridoxamine 5'-phosphate oxidase family protein [Pseudomonas sp. CCC3.2]MEB0210132.1 pyridoxamine 5'-phosphate oxidase family protein [Pseudomonas sp. AB6]
MITKLEQQTESPWHAGELAIQQSLNVAERMDGLGRRNIRDHLVEQHRNFFALLPFVVLGAVDAEGDVWATLRAGEPGFASAPDLNNLTLQLPRDLADPAESGLDQSHNVGLLGIDMGTRRRNRLNGSINRSDDSGFSIVVEESFGNCPQYIQLRQFGFNRPAQALTSASVCWLDRLDDPARELIGNAATFFVASYVDHEDGRRKVDVSHRGGNPGFVRVDDDGTLMIPDFAGNLFFCTLGNFLLNPKGGLVFVDFATGELLQMTGDVEVILDSPQIATFQGAERLWRFTPRRIVRRADALSLRWTAGPQ